jgi:hypothetical protein
VMISPADEDWVQVSDIDIILLYELCMCNFFLISASSCLNMFNTLVYFRILLLCWAWFRDPGKIHVASRCTRVIPPL